MTKQSLLLRLDNALKELDEIRADLRAEAQAEEALAQDDPDLGQIRAALSAQCDEELPPRDYLAAYEEYAAEPAHKKGDVQIRGEWYNEVPSISCEGCAFNNPGKCTRSTEYHCTSAFRSDKRNVIFVKVA